jgi:hypothetical protein
MEFPSRLSKTKLDERSSRLKSTEGPESAEAVRKHGDFLRLAEQSEILRDFLASERSEGLKKRTK